MVEENGPMVLVVEDEPGVRLFVEAVLARNGYEPLTAGSAAEAISLAGRHAGRIGMVISDVFLPDMSGQTLVERLREDSPGLPAVLMSGYPFGSHPVDDVELDLPIIGKPFTARDLLKHLRTSGPAA